MTTIPGYLDLVFDGHPGPEGPRFVEAENAAGQSIDAGAWIKRDDGYWVLRIRSIPDAAPTPPEVAPVPMQWRDGEPPHPWKEEWFIAETTFGDRVVLKALPEEFSYDYKTADETYLKADRIKRWMQFPDSEYIAPPEVAADRDVMTDAEIDEIANAGYRNVAGGIYSSSVYDFARAVLASGHSAPADRDAARYRLLREQDSTDEFFVVAGSNGRWGECGHRELCGEVIDAKCDAALAAKGAK